MEAKKIFTIGEINEETKNEFKSFLRETKDNQPIELYFNSWGGNTYIGKVMGTFIYCIKKRHPSRRFIHRGNIAASAAFRLFIRGDERIVTKDSIIQPHLPEPNEQGNTITHESLLKERKSVLLMIKGTLPLVTEEDITRYNNQPLPLEFMVNKNIVTKVVDQF